MKRKKLSESIRSASGREKLTAVHDRDLVLALGAGYITIGGAPPAEACPHVDYPASGV